MTREGGQYREAVEATNSKRGGGSTTSQRERVGQCNVRGGDAKSNQHERGAEPGENGGATREGWRNRVAEDAVTREESNYGLGGIYRTILVYHNIQVPTLKNV